MSKSLFFVLASLSLLVTAQVYGAPAPSSSAPAASSSGSPKSTASSAGQHTIQVAPGGGLTFSPDTITADAGDVVTFVFAAGSPIHSVTQSSFGSPCNLLNEGATNGTVGFDSGFVAGTSFSITVQDSTTPIWFHCKQGGPPNHCGSGMVGAINAPSTGNTFANFQQAAKALGSSFAADTGVGQSSLPGATGAGSAPGSQGAPSSTAPPSSKTSAPSAAIPNAARSGALVVALSALFVYMF